MQIVFSHHILMSARVLTIIDTDELEAVATGNLTRLKSPAPFFKGALALLRADARRQFEAGGDPAWPALAASTIAAKANLGLPAMTKKGNIPTRLKQGGAFGPSGIGIATGRRRDAWVRMDSPDHIETVDEASGTVSIGSKVPYEVFQSMGTGPYTIRPVNAKALAFIGSNGNRRFASVVHHPGLQPRPVRLTPNFTESVKQALVGYFHGEKI